MKRSTYDFGASLAEWKDTKPGMFETWSAAISSLGGLVILALFFIVLFMWGLV